MKASKAVKHDTKWVFLKKGTCSRTLFYIMNREFGNPSEPEEKAIDPMAGGIIQNGYQCGQLWGATAAVGVEALKRSGDLNVVTSVTVKTAQNLIDSFKEKAPSQECVDIIESKVENNTDALKLMISGKFLKCLRIADKWAPEAIKVAKEGLEEIGNTPKSKCQSCASIVAKNMGGTDMHAAMVAGYAGGLGLSGSGCGALSAAVIMATLNYEKKNGKSTYPCPDASKVLDIFMKETDYEFECNRITGKKFIDIDDHSRFIEGGGCENLINRLAGFKNVNI